MTRFRTLVALLVWGGLLLSLPACDNNGEEGGGDPVLPGDGGGGGGDGGGGGGGGSGGGETLGVVFTSDNDLDGVRDLFTLVASGRRLNLARALGASVEVFAVSPDDHFVAFGAAGLGLYVTAVDSDAPTRLSPPGVFEVLEIAWSPDGTRIAYRAEKDGAPAQLYLARADASEHLDLSGTAGSVRNRIRWMPDGQRIAFRSDRAVAEQWELYTILFDGTGEAQLSRTQAPPGVLRAVSYSVAPAGNRVAFRADLDVAGEFELWVREAAGLAPAVLVSNETGTEGGILPDDWKWKADGQKLAYRRRVTATGLNALFCVDRDGTNAAEVSGAMNESVKTYEWAGDRLAFRDGDSIHVTAGAGVTDIVAGTTVVAMQVSPTGNEIGYLAGSLSRPDFFIAEVTGGPPVLAAEEVRTFVWLPASPLAQTAAVRARYATQDATTIAGIEYDPAAGTVVLTAIGSPPPRTSYVEFDVDGTPAAFVPMGDADMRHLPVVGDFDGDGADEVGGWTPQGFVSDSEPFTTVGLAGVDDWGFATDGIVRLENATGVTFELHLDVFVDDIAGKVGVVAVDPARVGPGATNCYEGTAPAGANAAGVVTGVAIAGKGFPAQGTLTAEKRYTLEDIFFGAVDFGDANGEFDFCQRPKDAIGKTPTTTVRDSPGGTAIVFQASLDGNLCLARDATGEWVKVRMWIPGTGATYDGWVETADVTLGSDVMKLPIE